MEASNSHDDKMHSIPIRDKGSLQPVDGWDFVTPDLGLR